MKENYLVVLAVLALVAVVGIFWYLNPGKTTAPLGASTPSASAVSAVGAPTPNAEPNAIFMKTQQQGRNAVSIDRVLLVQAGYVVIHEIATGKPASIVAVSPFLLPPENKNVVVPVPAGLVPGKSYFAMLHSDNGNGSFRASDDAPVKDTKGNVVMVMFTIVSPTTSPNN